MKSFHKEFLAIELENAVASAETAEHALMEAQTELIRLRVETEQWKNRYQQTALTDSRLKVCEADLARVNRENATLRRAVTCADGWLADIGWSPDGDNRKLLRDALSGSPHTTLINREAVKPPGERKP